MNDPWKKVLTGPTSEKPVPLQGDAAALLKTAVKLRMHSCILATVALLTCCATPPERKVFMSGNGIVDLPSKYSVAETVKRLESSLRSKGIKVFTRID
jgi:hypothetical protein